jgi:S-adenosylmethionine synthetase
VAKNVVAAGLARRLEVQIAYAIGVARPVSVFVESFGTSKLSNTELADLIAGHFDLRPAAIIEQLELRRPIYRQTAAYGHFGRNDLDLPWERTDRAAELADRVGLKKVHAA